MEKTTRRHLLRAAAVGGVTASGIGGLLSASGASAAEQKPGKGNEDHAHDNRPLTDKRALTVVSFGQWDADPANPLDRQPINTEPENRLRNIHLMLPFEADVDQGGAVSFNISGVHQILIYGPGAEFDDLMADWIAANRPVITLPAPLPPLVDFATGRVYRGLNPFALQYLPLAAPPPDTPNNMVVDRIEAVNFKEPGRYLVVCGVLPHFLGGMYGYVNVKA